MSSDALLQILLRALPALLVFVLGFLAANDVRTRKQWTKFLYSVGSVRADQQDDPKKQGTVKWPFFAMALILLWLPFTYYRLATRKFEVGTESDLFKKSEKPAEAAKPTPTPRPTPSGPTPPPPPLPPGQSAPAASSAPAFQPSTPTAAKTPIPNTSGSGPHL